MGKLVSVIITTHNRLEQLKEAVESVRNQNYKNIELIIVNDNSTDETAKYLNELKKNIRIPMYFKNLFGEKRGGNYARNVGIEMSEGEYIAFLDDDDFWTDEKIAKQVEKMEDDKETGIVYCGFKRITDDYIETITRPNSFFKGDLKDKVFCKIFTVTSCIMIKRNVLSEVNGFDEKLSHWQEYDLLIRCLQITQVDFVDDILVVIRVNSLSKNRLSNQVEGWENSVSYLYVKHESLINKLDDEILNSMYANYYLDGASRYAAIDNKQMHKKYMLNAWKKSKKITHFIRYVFNLTPMSIEKIKSLL